MLYSVVLRFVVTHKSLWQLHHILYISGCVCQYPLMLSMVVDFATATLRRIAQHGCVLMTCMQLSCNVQQLYLGQAVGMRHRLLAPRKACK